MWTFIKGEGLIVDNGKIKVVQPGDVIVFNKGEQHSVKAVSNLEFIEVQSGLELFED